MTSPIAGNNPLENSVPVPTNCQLPHNNWSFDRTSPFTQHMLDHSSVSATSSSGHKGVGGSTGGVQHLLVANSSSNSGNDDSFDREEDMMLVNNSSMMSQQQQTPTPIRMQRRYRHNPYSMTTTCVMLTPTPVPARYCNSASGEAFPSAPTSPEQVAQHQHQHQGINGGIVVDSIPPSPTSARINNTTSVSSSVVAPVPQHQYQEQQQQHQVQQQQQQQQQGFYPHQHLQQQMQMMQRGYGATPPRAAMMPANPMGMPPHPVNNGHQYGPSFTPHGRPHHVTQFHQMMREQHQNSPQGDPRMSPFGHTSRGNSNNPSPTNVMMAGPHNSSGSHHCEFVTPFRHHHHHQQQQQQFAHTITERVQLTRRYQNGRPVVCAAGGAGGSAPAVVMPTAAPACSRALEFVQQ